MLLRSIGRICLVPCACWHSGEASRRSGDAVCHSPLERSLTLSGACQSPLLAFRCWGQAGGVVWPWFSEFSAESLSLNQCSTINTAELRRDCSQSQTLPLFLKYPPAHHNFTYNYCFEFRPFLWDCFSCCSVTAHKAIPGWPMVRAQLSWDCEAEWQSVPLRYCTRRLGVASHSAFHKTHTKKWTCFPLLSPWCFEVL